MSLKIDRQVVLRGTVTNILGGLTPMALSLVVLPKVLGALGTERYGILSLTLVAAGYFASFDMGLGTASSKYVAEELGRGREDCVPAIIWTALAGELALGLVCGVALAFIGPWLAESWFKLPPAIQPEVRSAIMVLGLIVPIMFMAPTLQGAVEAAQRFDLSNAVAVPSSLAISGAIFVGATLGYRLPGIVALVVLVRALNALVLLALCLGLFPSLGRSISVSFATAKRLLKYGVWFSAGGFLGPILMSADRFLLGRYESLSDVTYFSVPHSLMQRFWLLPLSLVRTLFPAFSAISSDREHLEDLYLRSVKYVLLVGGPLILLLSTFASDIFTAWLGSAVAAHSAPALRILLYGALFVLLSYVSGTLMEATGRPDLPALWNVAAIPVNAVLVYLLVRWWGVIGAAWSYTLRTTAQGLWFTVMAARTSKISYAVLTRHRLWETAGLLVLQCALMAATPLAGTFAGRCAAFGCGAGLVVALGWFLMFDDTDRDFVRAQLTLKLRSA